MQEVMSSNSRMLGGIKCLVFCIFLVSLADHMGIAKHKTMVVGMYSWSCPGAHFIAFTISTNFVSYSL
jgi:hypothetical protein